MWDQVDYSRFRKYFYILNPPVGAECNTRNGFSLSLDYGKPEK